MRKNGFSGEAAAAPASHTPAPVLEVVEVTPSRKMSREQHLVKVASSCACDTSLRTAARQAYQTGVRTLSWVTSLHQKPCPTLCGLTFRQVWVAFGMISSISEATSQTRSRSRIDSCNVCKLSSKRHYAQKKLKCANTAAPFFSMQGFSYLRASQYRSYHPQALVSVSTWKQHERSLSLCDAKTYF